MPLERFTLLRTPLGGFCLAEVIRISIESFLVRHWEAAVQREGRPDVVGWRDGLGRVVYAHSVHRGLGQLINGSVGRRVGRLIYGNVAVLICSDSSRLVYGSVGRINYGNSRME